MRGYSHYVGSQPRLEGGQTRCSLLSNGGGFESVEEAIHPYNASTGIAAFHIDITRDAPKGSSPELLGRDDRIISSHGRETRYPFLSLSVVNFGNLEDQVTVISVRCSAVFENVECVDGEVLGRAWGTVP
ncbi:hypothetical protein AB1N83_011285 [Pleurotus pulmonarius]